MRQSWQEEFERKYNRPAVERVTVGFSGIDPNPKYVTPDNLDGEILERLRNLEIRIDSGNVDPGTPEPTPAPVQPIITTTDHERLDNLLAGTRTDITTLPPMSVSSSRTFSRQGLRATRGTKAIKETPAMQER